MRVASAAWSQATGSLAFRPRSWKAPLAVYREQCREVAITTGRPGQSIGRKPPNPAASRKPGGKRRSHPKYGREQDETASGDVCLPGPRVERLDSLDTGRLPGALPWHRTGTQEDHLAQDALLPVAASTSASSSADVWWAEWKADWDEDWDWEDKWHPGSASALEPRDDPRRPRGPLVQLTDQAGAYKPVAALKPAEVTAAFIAARGQPATEATWQALCRRAEVVAVGLAPADLLAVVRCVAEAQAGQLQLLWKLAGFAVEKISAFTADDLVCLASVYASLDTAHRGLLNVIALIFADVQDDRTLTPLLAVELLAAFARAKYPLPLLIQSVRQVLSDAHNEQHILPPSEAIRALFSFTDLAALDTRMIDMLLSSAFACAGQENAPLAVVCSACRWVLQADTLSHRLDQPAPGQNQLSGGPDEALVNEDATGYEVSASVRLAVALVCDRARSAFAEHDLDGLRVISGGRDLQCVLPRRSNGGGTGSAAGAAALVLTADLLAAAELFAGRLVMCDPAAESDAALAAALLRGAVLGDGAKGASAWPLEHQVRWLSVAAQVQSAAAAIANIADGAATLNARRTLLRELAGHAAQHRLVPHAAAIFGALASGIAEDEALADGVALAARLAEEVRKNMFRLTLADSHTVLRGGLRFVAQLPPEHPHADLRAELAGLFSKAVETLPAKCRSEAVFQTRPREGVNRNDIVAWCALLTDVSLLERVDQSYCSASGSFSVPEEVWLHLANEAKGVIACGDIDGVAASLLEAFVQEGSRRKWEVEDTESPLGIVAAIVKSEWLRATARDGELEDPIHEPAPIPEAAECELRRLFQELGLGLPSARLAST